MSDLPPLLRRLEELEARRARENPRDAFLGVGICIIGLAVIFGGLRPVPGMAPWMIQVIGGFIVMLGLFWAFNALRMKRASTAASLIAGVLLLAIMNWGAFGPGERFCTTGRMRTPISEADCRFVLGAFSLFLDAVALLGVVAFIMRKK